MTDRMYHAPASRLVWGEHVPDRAHGSEEDA
jgi:hypothetical protein